MRKTIRRALGLLVGMAGAVATVSATTPNAQPEPSTEPKAKPAEQPPAAAKDADSPPPAVDAATPDKDSDDASVRTPPRVSAEDVLKAFQTDRPTRAPIAPSGEPDETAFPAAPPGTGTSRRLPDGFFLVDRVGRVVNEGQWYVFVFEGYSESHPEPPIKLLPNQLLERMVLASEGASGSTVFIVSGEVTEFKSENYLLLRKLLRRRNLGNLQK